MVSVDFVHGQCPLSPWTISTETMDNVYGLSGQCLWTHWTLSMDPRSNTPTGQCQWTMSTESMDFLQTGTLHYGKSNSSRIEIGNTTATAS